MQVPDADALRPTPDRVRETLFNWLEPCLAGARVLDLFAGSGVLGLEALSRGAAHATLVDDNPVIGNHLRDTASELRAEGLDVVVADAMAFLRRGERDLFDVVFVDPPYAYAGYEKLCEVLESGNLLSARAFVYLELSARRSDRLQMPSSWERHRAGRAGEVEFELWRRRGGVSGGNAPVGYAKAD